MPIEYENIIDIGIVPLPIKILVPNHHCERVMVYQCTGNIDSGDKVLNNDKELTEKKFTSFFNKAYENKPSLVVTPEYSCPWTVVEKIINDSNLQPDKGALWLLGCESITPEYLNEISDQTKDKVKWIFDIKQKNGGQIFLSPAIYLFHIKIEGGEDKLCAIVQFKHHDMGGDVYERDKLINGTTRYVIQNKSNESIKLITLICADSIIFNDDELEPYVPYLIIHIQLNEKPYHASFKKYRTDLFLTGKGKNIEILSLNWAKGFTVNNNESKDYGGSAYYMQSDKTRKEPEQSENIIDENHSKGIYLRFDSINHYSAFLFSPDEAIFEFNATKVSQGNHPVNSNRSGIKSENTYVWLNDKWDIVDNINDGIQNPFLALGGFDELNVCDREKLLTICIGKIPENVKIFNHPVDVEKYTTLKECNWHIPRNMYSYNLNGIEVPQGTLAKLEQSQNGEVDAALDKFKTLQKIISDKSKLPDILFDYKKINPVFSVTLENDYRYNLSDGSGGSVATVSFLGTKSKEMAKQQAAHIEGVLMPTRLVIWYMDGLDIKYIDKKIGSITQVREMPGDITNG